MSLESFIFKAFDLTKYKHSDDSKYKLKKKMFFVCQFVQQILTNVRSIRGVRYVRS